MEEIIFIYNSVPTTIQCQKNESMKDICQKFSSKAGIDLSNVYFLYMGKMIDFHSKYNELMKKSDNIIDKVKILVYPYENQNNDENKKFVISNQIICPTCNEICLMQLNDFIVNLNECGNGHKINNILLNKYEKTQEFDQSKILCDICKDINKNTSFKNEFYYCLTCKKNICPLCKSIHIEGHEIIEYERKNYKCSVHNEKYNSYCNKCKKNLCMICESDHLDKENILYYKNILPKKEIIESQINELKIKIGKFNETIQRLKNILDKICENMKIYYNINNNLILNYQKKNRNYQSLKNIEEITNNNNNILKDINKIINENNYINLFNNIINLYKKMFNEYEEKRIIKKNEYIITVCNKMKEILNKEINPHLKEKHFNIFYNYVKDWDWLENVNLDWKWWWYSQNPWWNNEGCEKCNNLLNKYNDEIKIYESQRIIILNEKEKNKNSLNKMKEILNKEITPHLKNKHYTIYSNYVSNWDWLEYYSLDWKWWWWSNNPWWNNTICQECINLLNKYNDEIKIYDSKRNSTLKNKEMIKNICNQMIEILNKEITPHLKKDHLDIFNNYVIDWDWLEKINSEWKWWWCSNNQFWKNNICEECNNLLHKYEDEIKIYDSKRIDLLNITQ